MRKNVSLMIVLGILSALLNIQAEVRVSPLFSDNMVVQQNQPVKVWGTADKHEKIAGYFCGQKKEVKADRQGKWMLAFDPMNYGGPYVMEIEGKKNRIEIKNILVGEVWLCSGQSNMEWTMEKVNNAEYELSHADYPMIRTFNVARTIYTTPQEIIDGSWTVCSPATVSTFSAVAYFFARKLHTELNIPVGIINSSWGGTDIETWISESAIKRLPEHYMLPYKNVKIGRTEKEWAKMNQAKIDFYEALKVDRGMDERWYDRNTDISDWKSMNVPQLWENVLGDLDGIMWYRYDLLLAKDDAGKKAVMNFGVIDDDDMTWVNGVYMGMTQGYTTNRRYEIPEGVLTEGINTIVVKVLDTHGGGGFYGTPEEMYLEVNNRKKYYLSGEWQYKMSVSSENYDFIELVPNVYPAMLYNSMINPLTRLPIKGAIWYQGENNAPRAYDYKTLFPALIKDWRSRWGYDFPFYWVQLANYMAKDDTPQESDWAELRQAQSLALELPRTGQAVITDIGDANDIHPRNKQDVGLRLALIALNREYGRDSLICSGPTFSGMEIVGNRAVISFDHAENGLCVKGKYKYIEGFAIAGADKQFKWAQAYAEGNKVIVFSDEVENPVAVRYAWANNPDVNLFNVEGLPVVPFKTDDWEWSTKP